MWSQGPPYSVDARWHVFKANVPLERRSDHEVEAAQADSHLEICGH
jgi:hypothetical protein